MFVLKMVYTILTQLMRKYDSASSIVFRYGDDLFLRALQLIFKEEKESTRKQK